MKKTVLKLLSVILSVILLAGSGACALAELQDAGDGFLVSTDPAYEKLAGRITRTALKNNFSGSVLLATEDGIILYGGPKALTRDGLPADAHTTYDIGSCSKVFTAVAVFQLIEAGKMSLSDPVTRFFPAYEAGGEITVYHLLHMQSGIADYVNNPSAFWVNADWPEEEARVIARMYSDDVSDGEFLENLYAAPLVFTPGSMEDYSNTNYHLLAMIVEQVSGMDFGDYLRENVFDICGLEHTTAMAVGDETSVPKGFGELLEAGMVNEDGYSFQPETERGAGGIHTCVTDLWTFDKALLSGHLVSSESFREMTHFDPEIGCGLMTYGEQAFGHSGRNATYTTQNIIADSELYGRIYFICVTSADSGSYGLSAIMNAAMSELGCR